MPLAWIALNSVNGLGPVRIKNLLERFGSPEAVFKESPERLISSQLIPESCAHQLADRALFDDAERQLELAEHSGVVILTLASAQYPSYLKEIFAPPPVLYIKGNLTAFSSPALAIVGTRNPTAYGKNVTVTITRGIVEGALTVVSGLARGIDTVAHETCLDLGGKTIAVLGCGIDIIYPFVNSAIADRLLEKGALVSEFPIGTPPNAFNFPRRNRIISGLSAGTLVIEAGEKSGSLITAHYALQQDRDIFAVPGPINSPMSNGTFNLIKNGAIPVRSAKEILDSLQLITAQQVMDFNQSPAPKIPDELLTDAEREIVARIGAQPLRIDELCGPDGQVTPELFDILLNLELKGCIRQVSGQQFVRSN